MEGVEIKSSRKEDEKRRKKRKRVDVLMESVAESKDKIAPFVGYFPSGFDPLKHQKLEGGEVEEDPKIRVFRNEKFPSRLQLVVSPKGSNVDFIGSSHYGEAAAPQVCTYAVGILDKEKQSLRIVPIAANKIFRLEPRVRGAPQELKEEPTTEKSETRMRDLTNLYGSKSSKTRARKWEAIYQKECDLEDQKITEGKVENIEINKESLETATTHVANIPPHDATATSPDKAYPLDKIILKGEWNHLLDIYELLQSEEGAAIKFCRRNNYPSFVCNRLHKLGQIQDEDEKKNIAGIFSYISYLLKFKNLTAWKQNSTPAFHNASAKHHGIPITLFQKFAKIFGGSSSSTAKMSKEKLNLLISYISVLTLFADGFETEISDIASDLKMSPVTLKPHYQLLGCKLSSVKRLVIVTLPVPLKLPELRRRVSNRRR